MSLTVIFTFMSLLIAAQPNRPDVVYLKNGSIIRGDILEVVPNETIKIKTSHGRTFVFKMEEVERAGKYKNEKVIPKPSGYFLMARLGPNIRSFDTWDFSAGIINGIQVNQYISLGIGAEAAPYVYDEYNKSSIMFFPIFFDARFYNPKHVVQPMFSMQFGYSIAGNKKNGLNDNNGYYDFEPTTGGGGVYYGINCGARWQATKRTAVIVDAGLSMQRYKGFSSETYGVVSLRGNVGVCWNLRPEKK